MLGIKKSRSEWGSYLLFHVFRVSGHVALVLERPCVCTRRNHGRLRRWQSRWPSNVQFRRPGIAHARIKSYQTNKNTLCLKILKLKIKQQARIDTGLQLTRSSHVFRILDHHCFVIRIWFELLHFSIPTYHFRENELVGDNLGLLIPQTVSSWTR